MKLENAQLVTEAPRPLMQPASVAPIRQSYLNSRCRSFTHAARGIRYLFQTQPNARIHFACIIAAILLAITLKISRIDWLWITAAIAAVWSGEALNTALEYLADAIHPHHHPLIGKAKDLAAGAVLVLALAAAIIGAIVFAPYLILPRN